MILRHVNASRDRVDGRRAAAKEFHVFRPSVDGLLRVQALRAGLTPSPAPAVLHQKDVANQMAIRITGCAH